MQISIRIQSIDCFDAESMHNNDENSTNSSGLCGDIAGQVDIFVINSLFCKKNIQYWSPVFLLRLNHLINSTIVKCYTIEKLSFYLIHWISNEEKLTAQINWPMSTAQDKESSYHVLSLMCMCVFDDSFYICSVKQHSYLCRYLLLPSSFQSSLNVKLLSF